MLLLKSRELNLWMINYLHLALAMLLGYQINTVCTYSYFDFCANLYIFIIVGKLFSHLGEISIAAQVTNA
jgi:hypothetical protein